MSYDFKRVLESGAVRRLRPLAVALSAVALSAVALFFQNFLYALKNFYKAAIYTVFYADSEYVIKQLGWWVSF